MDDSYDFRYECTVSVAGECVSQGRIRYTCPCPGPGSNPHPALRYITLPNAYGPAVGGQVFSACDHVFPDVGRISTAT